MNALPAVLALIGLYARQTNSEQIQRMTVERNGIGFNATDADFCTSVAVNILEGKYPSHKQIAAIQKILPKYKKQIEAMTLENYRSKIDPEVLKWLTGYEDRQLNLEKKEKPTTPGKLQLDAKGRLEFEPFIYPTSQVKEWGFRRGDREKWTWVAEWSLDRYNRLMDAFKGLEVSKEVMDLVKQQEELERLPEDIENNSVIFQYQKESIQWLRARQKALLALAPGLGKTLAAIKAAESLPEAPLATLVVAPLSLLYNWKKEVKMWADRDATIWHGNVQKWEEPSDNWIITNYDTLVRNLEAFKGIAWDVLIIDESVMVKNRKAKRSLALKEFAANVGIVWELSGAPTTRFYDDMWSQLNILANNRFRSYWRFAKTYCNVWHNGWGFQITNNQPDAADRIKRDLADIYYCRTQDQVLNLPEFIFEDVEIPMTQGEWKIYSEMQEGFLSNLPEGDVVLAPNVLAQIVRLVQFASNPAILNGKPDYISSKWKAALEMLEYVELPAIVWVTFVETGKRLLALAKQAGYRAELLTGATKEEERFKIVEAFQNGEIDVLIAHPGVGKFGLTLTKGRTAIYLERSYNGDDYYQSLHRIRRIGTKESPRVIHLKSVSPKGSNTIDHVIGRVLQFRKDKNIELTTGILREIGGKNAR